MKRTTGLMATLIVGALMVLSAGLLAQSKADVALRAAIETETVKGDLKGAIEQYKALAAGADRAVAAKALVRLGECYQKQGSVESTKAWERVVREFPDQKAAAAEAQKHLAAGGSQPDSGVTETRVFAVVDLDWRAYGRSVSRDGRYIAFTMPYGYGAGPVVVLHDLLEHTERKIFSFRREEGWPAVPNGNLDAQAMVSPDGRQVVFLRSSAASETRVLLVNADGSNVRTLFSQTGTVALCGWSPDGRRILATSSPAGPRTGSLLSISAADGSSAVVVSAGVLSARYSPDGRHLALEKVTGPSIARGLYLTTAAGGEEVPFVQDNNAFNPMWTADGKRILFSMRRGQSAMDLWSIRIANGKPEGQAELVKKEAPELLAAAASGSYFYAVKSSTEQLYTVDIDPKTGATVSAPNRLSVGGGSNTGAAWSPDGTSLAYLSNRPEGRVLVIRSAESGSERLISPKSLPYFGWVNYLAWFPDGKSLLLQAGDRVYRTDLALEQSRPVLVSAKIRSGGHGNQGRIRLTSDGLVGYYLYMDDSRRTKIMRQGMEDGLAVEVCRAEESILGPSLSPDGSTLVYSTSTDYGTDRERWAIMTVPASGGAPKEIFGARFAIQDPVWSKDGRWVYFATSRSLGTQEHQVQDIWRVPAGGGTPIRLNLGLHFEMYLDFSPDGRHLVFRDSHVSNELWVMRNLFPAPKTGK